MVPLKILAQRAAPGPYVLLRDTKTRMKRWRWESRLKHVLGVVTKDGLQVQRGPFAGMVYTQSVIDTTLAAWGLGSTLVPKFLGSYEAELHGALEVIIQTPYQTIIDIGSGEGYYVVGLARRIPGAHVYAFELEEVSNRLGMDMAKANGVAARITFAGACERANLAPLLSQGRTLIICDCEGYELELLQPDAVPGLATCDVLVELHDPINPVISATILARFAATHTSTLIDTAARDPKAYPVLAPLSVSDQVYALDELRPPMQWAWLQAKRSTS